MVSVVKVKASTVKRRKTIGYVKIALAALLIVAIVSAAVIYYNPNNPPKPPKPEATDFFRFTDFGAEAESVNGTDRIVKLRTVHFGVTPVGGNATEFNINPGGRTDPLDYYFPRIDNGTIQYIDVTLNDPVLSTRNETTLTFPIKILVYCMQAEGAVTLQIPQELIDVL